MKTIINYMPFDKPSDFPQWDIHQWPFSFIAHPQKLSGPSVIAYKRLFTIKEKKEIRIHVTADERYELFLDGILIGRGSERGDKDNWFYETYDLDFSAGKHVIVARVFSLGAMAGMAQISVVHGFLLAPEGDYAKVLGTGVAQWESSMVYGYEFKRYQAQARFAVPANVIIDGNKFPWGIECGKAKNWVAAHCVEIACSNSNNPHKQGIRKLMPATLPPQIYKPFTCGTIRFAEYTKNKNTETRLILEKNNNVNLQKLFQNLFTNNIKITIPPNTRLRAIIDLDNYVCGYPKILVSGGAGSTLRIFWAESLCVSPKKYLEKNNRNEIFGKCFYGAGDTFISDGGKNRKYQTPWWMPGRYLEIFIETLQKELVIQEFSLFETRYPLESVSFFSIDDEPFQSAIPIMVRTLQMCCHETYMDCPYCEQLMYSGDSRPQILAGYAITNDNRMVKKAISLFALSQIPSGLTQSRYPSSESQVIPPFSLAFIGMIHDYALWRNDNAFVQKNMPYARRVIDAWLSWQNKDGLIEGAHRWMYIDWVDEWVWGVPPESENGGISGVVNWLFVYILTQAVALEEYLGENELALRYSNIAHRMSSALQEKLFDIKRNLFADDIKKTVWSEHSQCFALLSGTVPKKREVEIVKSLTTATDLIRTTIFSSHFLFEALYKAGHSEMFYQRLEIWRQLKDSGFKTTWEIKGHSRSDCHGWGAHPLYHLYATILGVRPAKMGNQSIIIKPMLGNYRFASGKLIHPKGTISVSLKQHNGIVSGSIVLPKGLHGTFIANGRQVSLGQGKKAV